MIIKNELGPYFFKECTKKKKVSQNFALREVPKNVIIGQRQLRYLLLAQLSRATGNGYGLGRILSCAIVKEDSYINSKFSNDWILKVSSKSSNHVSGFSTISSNKYWDSSFFRVPGVSWTFQFPGVLIDHPRFSSFNFKERCFSSTHQRKTTSNSMLCVTISNFNLFFVENSELTRT